MARATASSSSRITWSGNARVRAARVTGRRMIDMRDVLQRTHIGLRARRAAADQQHRRPRQRGVGHGGDGVGDAGPGGHHGDAEVARQLGMGVRHVHGGALVAHVDDADALPGDVVPDRLDVAALQAENAVDAARLQEARDPGRAGQFVAVEVLAVMPRLEPTSYRVCAAAVRSCRVAQNAMQNLAGGGARHVVLAR